MKCSCTTGLSPFNNCIRVTFPFAPIFQLFQSEIFGNNCRFSYSGHQKFQICQDMHGKNVGNLFYRWPFCSIDCQSFQSIAILFYRQLFCSIDIHYDLSIADSSIGCQYFLLIALLFYRQLFCSIDSQSALSIANQFK